MSAYSYRQGGTTYRCTIYSRGVIGSVCAFCDQPSTRLCDGPPWSKHRHTCDATICARCATRTGVDRDLCPDCVKGNRS